MKHPNVEPNPDSVLVWPKAGEADCLIRSHAHDKLDDINVGVDNPMAELREEQGVFRIYSGPQYRPKAG